MVNLMVNPFWLLIAYAAGIVSCFGLILMTLGAAAIAKGIHARKAAKKIAAQGPPLASVKSFPGEG